MNSKKNAPKRANSRADATTNTRTIQKYDAEGLVPVVMTDKYKGKRFLTWTTPEQFYNEIFNHQDWWVALWVSSMRYERMVLPSPPDMLQIRITGDEFYRSIGMYATLIILCRTLGMKFEALYNSTMLDLLYSVICGDTTALEQIAALVRDAHCDKLSLPMLPPHVRYRLIPEPTLRSPFTMDRIIVFAMQLILHDVGNKLLGRALRATFSQDTNTAYYISRYIFYTLNGAKDKLYPGQLLKRLLERCGRQWSNSIHSGFFARESAETPRLLQAMDFWLLAFGYYSLVGLRRGGYQKS